MALYRTVAVALVACMCFATAADAAQTVRLKVAFVPSRAGSRTTIELALRISGPHGLPPEPMTAFNLLLPAGMGIASTTLGQSNCYPADLFTSGIKGCSANAHIGFGTATAVVPVGSQVVTEKASLEALMGQPGKGIEVLFYAQADEPVFAQLIFPGAFQEGSPPYGQGLSTSAPLIQTWPGGPDLAITAFNSTIGPLHLTYYERMGGRTISYKPLGIRIPPDCPTGGYPFRAILSFQDGTDGVANYSVPCPRL